MLSIGNSINEIVHVFSQSIAQKEKEMKENRVPSEVKHAEKIDQQLGSFTQKTFHVPENDIRFLVSTLSKQVTEENRKYFMGMAQENLIALTQVDELIEIFTLGKKKDQIGHNQSMDEFIKLLQDYKINGNTFK